MSQPAIEIRGISKRYRIGQREARYRTFREAIVRAAKSPVERFRRLAGHIDENSSFWAVKNVSFDVQPGEVVGIIGRNGAGKSTLLKVLSRITEPTEGEVIIRGRVGSLLEVGTGFHNELTGRENVYLNGSILGMKRREIDRKFDEIVDFAGVERFLDTPVKHYSSGMKVRLGFAVAAHLEPEILIVDEVLAVGDLEFQNKCLGKMNEVAQCGRTVLFVSHNMGAVTTLCTRCVLLDAGSVRYDGECGNAIAEYLQLNQPDQAPTTYFEDDPDLAIAFISATLSSAIRGDTTQFELDEPVFVSLRIVVREPMCGSNLSLTLLKDGIPLGMSFDIDHDAQRFAVRPEGTHDVTVALPSHLLKPGAYTINIAAGRPGKGPIVVHKDALGFQVQATCENLAHKSYAPNRPGLMRLPISWNFAEAHQDRVR